MDITKTWAENIEAVEVQHQNGLEGIRDALTAIAGALTAIERRLSILEGAETLTLREVQNEH